MTEITNLTFSDLVLNSNKLVMLEFYIDGCGPCRRLDFMFTEASTIYTDIDFFKINSDENSEICKSLGVVGFPTILFFKGGQVVDKQVGGPAKQKFFEKIKSVILMTSN